MNKAGLIRLRSKKRLRTEEARAYLRECERRVSAVLDVGAIQKAREDLLVFGSTTAGVAQ